MFKLVVLSVLFAIAAAKPSHHHDVVEVAAPIIHETFVAPAAVSSSYRRDIIDKPATVTYVEPIAVAAPVISKTVVAPAAVSHTWRKEIISQPEIHYAPVVTKTVVEPAVSHTWRKDIVEKPAEVHVSAPLVYSAPVVHQTVLAAHAAPIAYETHLPVHASLPLEHSW